MPFPCEELAAKCRLCTRLKEHRSCQSPILLAALLAFAGVGLGIAADHAPEVYLASLALQHERHHRRLHLDETAAIRAFYVQIVHMDSSFFSFSFLIASSVLSIFCRVLSCFCCT
jgi:hypothetical protein